MGRLMRKTYYDYSHNVILVNYLFYLAAAGRAPTNALRPEPYTTVTEES